MTASMIMYNDWENQTASSIGAQLLGFFLIVLGVYILNATRDAQPGCAAGLRSMLGGFGFARGKKHGDEWCGRENTSSHGGASRPRRRIERPGECSPDTGSLSERSVSERTPLTCNA